MNMTQGARSYVMNMTQGAPCKAMEDSGCASPDIGVCNNGHLLESSKASFDASVRVLLTSLTTNNWPLMRRQICFVQSNPASKRLPNPAS